jgi:hypothetical protein
MSLWQGGEESQKQEKENIALITLGLMLPKP